VFTKADFRNSDVRVNKHGAENRYNPNMSVQDVANLYDVSMRTVYGNLKGLGWVLASLKDPLKRMVFSEILSRSSTHKLANAYVEVRKKHDNLLACADKKGYTYSSLLEMLEAMPDSNDN